MIKINVAEIKKRLTGSESFQYDLAPSQLNLTPEDADLEGRILVEGEMVAMLICPNSEELEQTFRQAGEQSFD